MLKIAIAKTAQQIDEVLKLRYHSLTGDSAVFNQEAASGAQQRLIDRFDTFPDTTHLIATDKSEVIGSLRLTIDSDVGMPSDSWIDLKNTLPAESKLMCCDLHCIKPSVTKGESSLAQSIHTTMGMLLVASYFALSENVTHIVALAGAELADRLKFIGFHTAICESTGIEQLESFKAIGANSMASTQTLVPLVLDIQKDLDDSFVQFSQQNEIQDLIHAYGCALYQPGEVILRAGAAGNCAFVIGEGEVDVRHPGSDKVIDTMGAGEVFGELALLTNQVRSADIIARTEVRAMILEKSVFVDYLLEQPKAALKVLESMGHRMKHLIDYCNTQTDRSAQMAEST